MKPRLPILLLGVIALLLLLCLWWALIPAPEPGAIGPSSSALINQATPTPDASAAVAPARLTLRLDGPDVSGLSLRGVVLYYPRELWISGGATGESGRLPAVPPEERPLEMNDPVFPLVVEDLPAAPWYRVGIWTEDGAAHSVATVPADRENEGGIVTGTVPPMQSVTGLRLLLPADHGPFEGIDAPRLRLRPTFDPETSPSPAEWFDLIRLMNPTLFAAFDWPPGMERDAPRPDAHSSLSLLSDQPLLLAPLVAVSEISLAFSTDSPDTPPLAKSFPLNPGRIVDVILQPGDLPSPEARGLELAGTLTFGDTGDPVAGAEVSRLDVAAPPRQTDADGRFRFPGLSRLRPSEFQVRPPPGDTLRPRYSAERRFVFNPDGVTTGTRVAEVAWTLPRLQWIALDLTEEQEREFRRSAAPGYPVYGFEHWIEDRWDAAEASQILYEREDVLGAVERPGRYRAVVLLDPLRGRVSDAAELGDGDAGTTVCLAARQPVEREVRLAVRDRATGAPLADTPLWINGTLPRGQPLSARTDAAGVVTLNRVGVDRLYLRVASPNRTVAPPRPAVVAIPAAPSGSIDIPIER